MRYEVGSKKTFSFVRHTSYFLLRSSAFTLIELILVIAMLGVLAVAVLTLTPSISPARLDAASKEIQSDIEYAKQKAMIINTTHGVQFTASGSFTVYRGTVATPVADPLTQQNMIITLANKYPGITIQTNYTVEFDNFGVPTTGGGGSVTITDGSNTKIISVAAQTGLVTIQ